VAKVGTSKAGGTISQQAAVNPWLAHGNKQQTTYTLDIASANYKTNKIAHKIKNNTNTQKSE
jgi:hypothetical protein